MSQRFEIERIYIAPEAQSDELTQRFLAAYPNAQVEKITTTEDPLNKEDLPLDADPITIGKRQILLCHYHGKWLKPCPGTLGHVCCNLWVVNPAEGCPLDCTYCILQSYLKRNPTQRIFTNINAMIEGIKERVTSEPNRYFRICTGELTDSLAWDDITDLSLKLVPLFAELDNAVLELKTKTTNIKNLLTLKSEHRGHTVVSWSVNAINVSASDELYAATLVERLEAAREVSAAGFRIGLHFDPIVHFPGWESAYREVIKAIFSHLKPQDIAWISIATLRYRRDLQEIMINRIPKSKLPFGEQFLAKDYKVRYIQPLRLKMLRFVWGELKSIWPQLPVYMCMESPVSWKTISGGLPVAGNELVEVFSRRGKR